MRTAAGLPYGRLVGPHHIWWDRYEYWLIHGSNHLELDAITRSLSEFRDNLSKEVAGLDEGS
ncbi:hypothetical protein [Streptomyces sp. NBC_00057]|uniref:hypothetical protein n=1 Tax=Streptomyces sp. NBC_00057 TaxID=2975634 RepID=UPI003870C7AC